MKDNIDPITTDIVLTIITGGVKVEEKYENQTLVFSRMMNLWISKAPEVESDFINDLMVLFDQDKETQLLSSLFITTSAPTPVDSNTEYFIRRINEEQQAVVLDKPN